MLLVPGPIGMTSWVPTIRNPRLRVSHENLRSCVRSFTVHSVGPIAFCLMRALVPTANGPSSSRLTDCIAGDQSGHRSTSTVARQTTAGGALMSIECLMIMILQKFETPGGVDLTRLQAVPPGSHSLR